MPQEEDVHEYPSCFLLRYLGEVRRPLRLALSARLMRSLVCVETGRRRRRKAARIRARVAADSLRRLRRRDRLILRRVAREGIVTASG